MFGPVLRATAAMMERSRGATIAFFLFAAAAVVATFHHLLWGALPIYRDLLLFTVPHKVFLASRLARWSIPLWNPLIDMGTPFLANPQSGVFYPMSAFLLLPFPVGFGAYLIAHYVVASWGMWALLRQRDLGKFSALFGALTFALGGFLVSLMNLTNHLQGAVWAPWVLLATVRLRRRRSARRVAAFALAVAMQLVSGSPETLLMTLTLATAWVAYTAADDLAVALRVEALLLVGGALALGLAAAQVVPTVEYLKHSPRGSSLPLDQVTAWSLQPVSLLQLLLPHSGATIAGALSALGPQLERSLPWILSFYVGIIPLCLAVVGIVFGNERRFWGLVPFVGVALALGGSNPLFVALYHALPGLLGKFRFPEKFFFLTHFAAGIVAAEGAEQILRCRPEAVRLTYVVALTFAILGVALLALRWEAPASYLEMMPLIAGKLVPPWKFVELAIDIEHKIGRMLALICVLLTLLLLHRRVLSSPVVSALLIVAATVDLAGIHADLNLSMPWHQLAAQHFPGDLDALRRNHERTFHYQLSSFNDARNESVPVHGLAPWADRISATQDLRSFYEERWQYLYPNVGLVADVPALSGGDAVGRTSDQLMLSSLSRLPRQRAVMLARAFGVRLLVGPEPLDLPTLERSPPTETGRFFVYRIPDTCPFVAAVTTLRVEPVTSKVVDALAEPGFPCRSVAFVPQLPAGWIDIPDDAGTPPQAELQFAEDDRVGVVVSSPRGTFLVVNASDFPGWVATVDGKPVQIHQTNAFVRGILVSAGQHRVEFRYRPLSVWIGAAISCLSLVVLALLAFRGRT